MFVYKFSYGLHKEQLKAGAKGNSSLTLPSWNEFVVATETSTAKNRGSSPLV